MSEVILTGRVSDSIREFTIDRFEFGRGGACGARKCTMNEAIILNGEPVSVERTTLDQLVAAGSTRRAVSRLPSTAR